MKPIVLELREPPRVPVDMSPLAPDRLQGMRARKVSALELWAGNARVPVGELFKVSGEDHTRLVIRNAGASLERIGAGMAAGHIEVEGDAGCYLGRGMRGGGIRVRGNCAEFCASAMQSGFIQVDGDVDDFLGAAVTGERQGMRGGLVLVKGNADDRVGDRMRRGLILIEGSAGDYCCSRMIAGTVAVLGGVGNATGAGMRRGSLLLAIGPDAFPATFVDTGAHSLGFLTLWARQFRALDSTFAHLDSARARVNRHVGDLANGGQGEILVWVKDPSPARESAV
ncbi:MAG: formylmethanofuran dehydrogenase subunit C [Gammaproteobacteria bacterium]